MLSPTQHNPTFKVEAPETYLCTALAFMGAQSSGTISLHSTDPSEPPIIDPKFLSHRFDRRVAIECTRDALDFLDQVTVLDPAYSEGWQRRATLHYTMGDPRKSMADIAEVLRREPRHLGALAGMAGILSEAGKDELALKAWQRYLDVYPADRDAQEVVTKLTEKIAGSRT